jgi:uncharacterized membrane protein (DUF106 family)
MVYIHPLTIRDKGCALARHVSSWRRACVGFVQAKGDPVMRSFIIGVLVTAFSLLVFSACSTIKGFLIDQQAPEKVAKVVDTYCDEIPEAQRAEARDAINAASTKGNSISITCASDSGQ